MEFHYKCEERPECGLNDGATKIFLNTRGTNPEEVSAELVEFLHYLENTTNQVADPPESPPLSLPSLWSPPETEL